MRGVIVLLVLVFLVIVGLLFLPDVKKIIPGNQAQENGQDIVDSKDINEGSGGSGTEQGQLTGQESGQTVQGSCSMQQVSYALKNLIVIQDCLEFDGEECVNKDVSCTFDAYNLDYEISGNFAFNLHLTEVSNPHQFIDSDYLEIYLEPRQNSTLEGSFNVQGSQAEEELTCVYEKSKVPKKEIC